MAKSEHFSSVRDWVDAEYSISIRAAGGLDEPTLSQVGQILRRVHPKSPAGILGLQAGDILYAVNGGVFDGEDLKKTFQPRWFGRSHTFDFLRPSTRQKLRVKGSAFPFGAQYGQTVGSFCVDFRNGDPDPHDIYQFWTEGPDGALAEIWPFFEAYNLRVLKNNGAPYDGVLPRTIVSTAPLAHETVVWPGAFAWLALCAAHAGQFDRAQRVLETVEQHFEKSGDSGMMSMFAAMAFTRSMLAENRGFIDMAVSHIEHAIEMSPETSVLYRQLSNLTGQTRCAPQSSFIGKKPEYNLLRQDPTLKFTQSDGHIDLQKSVARLKPGEFILISLMSGYRTNGPYVEGFQRAQIPLARLREKFREVHIITSWDKAHSRDLPHWPVMEPKLAKLGVDVSVLYDPDDTVSESLSLISAPTNLLIDHTGTVIAEGWLGDDAILWNEISH